MPRGDPEEMGRPGSKDSDAAGLVRALRCHGVGEPALQTAEALGVGACDVGELRPLAPQPFQDRARLAPAPEGKETLADNGQVPAGATLDYNGRPRFVDDHNVPDVGVGTGALVDMGAIEYARAVVLPYGCGNPAGSLSVLGGHIPATGATLTLRLDRSDAPRAGGDLPGPPLAARAGLVVGTAPLSAGCGAQLPGGYLQVDLDQPFSILWGEPWTGQPVDVELSIPDDPSLTGTSLFVQGAFVRLNPRGGLGSGVRLTESLELVLGY